jgi:uncharacterized protein YjiS (DUF1127 family)
LVTVPLLPADVAIRVEHEPSNPEEAVMLVMTFVTKTLSAVSGGAARAAAHSVTGTKNLVRAFLHRRDVMRLSELDERGLKDIGLVRSDIDGALAVSWLSDPSSVLQARSDQQQSAAARRRETGLRRPVVIQAVARPGAKEIKIACNA